MEEKDKWIRHNPDGSVRSRVTIRLPDELLRDAKVACIRQYEDSLSSVVERLLTAWLADPEKINRYAGRVTTEHVDD